jgi:hypothetical protein
MSCQGAAIDRRSKRVQKTVRRRVADGGRPEKRKFERKLWSALQTHLQGVNRATLAIVPEETNGHCAALLSRSSQQLN